MKKNNIIAYSVLAFCFNVGALEIPVPSAPPVEPEEMVAQGEMPEEMSMKKMKEMNKEQRAQILKTRGYTDEEIEKFEKARQPAYDAIQKAKKPCREFLKEFPHMHGPVARRCRRITAPMIVIKRPRGRGTARRSGRARAVPHRQTTR